jgi:demethylmenaquinone methyltransferase/2-methoxy-6-polyprenyl-1,4-benzoquinol methylase
MKMLARPLRRHEVPAMAPTDAGLEEERSAKEAASGSADKPRYVRAMFSDIAHRYDLLNHLLSLNIDRGWRRAAIAALEWPKAPAGRYLDLCSGTMDLAASLAGAAGFRGRVLAADFSERMLSFGRRKIVSLPVRPVVADAIALPLRDRSCDGALVAFGVRNLGDLDSGLAEAARVLRPGGRFVILEFTTPRSPLIRGAYQLYFNHVLPRVGGLLSGNRGAYRYLPESVARFPSESELAARLERAGFRAVSWRSLTLGIAAIHVGTRA